MQRVGFKKMLAWTVLIGQKAVFCGFFFAGFEGFWSQQERSDSVSCRFPYVSFHGPKWMMNQVVRRAWSPSTRGAMTPRRRACFVGRGCLRWVSGSTSMG